MLRLKKATQIVNQNKSIIWGLLLSSVVANYAIGNIIFICIGLCFIFQIISGKRFRLSSNYLPLIIYFFFGVLSLIWTTNLSATCSGIIKGLYIVLIPIFLSQYDRFTISDLMRMIRLCSIILLTYFIISIINSGLWYLEDGNLSHFFYHDLTSLSSNNAIYISFLTSCVFLILYNFEKKRKVDTFICLVLLIYLVMLSSKILILTTIIIQGVVTLQSKKSYFSKRNVIYLSIFILLSFSLYIFVDNPLKSRFMELSFNGLDEIWQKDDFSGQFFDGFSIRLFQWRIMIEMIQSGYIGLLGLGWNNVDYFSSQYFSYYNFYRGYFNINFHNQYLQTLGELGFIGLSILCSIFFMSFKKSSVNNVFLLIFISVSIISFISESYLNRQKGVIIFVTLYCILINMNKIEDAKRRSLESN